MHVLAITGGSWIFLAVVIALAIAVAFSLFGRHSRRQIQEHPREGRRAETAPGSEGPGDPSGSRPEDAPQRSQHGTR